MWTRLRTTTDKFARNASILPMEESLMKRRNDCRISAVLFRAIFKKMKNKVISPLIDASHSWMQLCPAPRKWPISHTAINAQQIDFLPFQP